MAFKMITPAEYQLPEAARQAILAQSEMQSESPIQTDEIERQRIAFVQKNGSNFGLEIAEQ